MRTCHQSQRKPLLLIDLGPNSHHEKAGSDFTSSAHYVIVEIKPGIWMTGLTHSRCWAKGFVVCGSQRCLHEGQSLGRKELYRVMKLICHIVREILRAGIATNLQVMYNEPGQPHKRIGFTQLSYVR
jgi:hypothetical protein